MRAVFFGAPQDSEEWLALRASQVDINASDVSALCGCGYKSPQQLFREKTGRAAPLSATASPFLRDILQRGHDLEPEARHKLAAALGVELHPGHLWVRTDSTCRWGATPDAIRYERVELLMDMQSGEELAVLDYYGPKQLVEIKCPVTLQGLRAGCKKHARFGVQQLCQMYCTDSTHSDSILFAYHPKEQSLVSYTRFSQRVFDSCVRAPVANFMEFLRADVEPPREFTSAFRDSNDRLLEFFERRPFRAFQWDE